MNQIPQDEVCVGPLNDQYAGGVVWDDVLLTVSADQY